MDSNLWERRSEKNISLNELARLSGIGKSTINNIENGITSPTLLQLECLASALQVSIKDLIKAEFIATWGSNGNLSAREKMENLFSKMSDNQLEKVYEYVKLVYVYGSKK